MVITPLILRGASATGNKSVEVEVNIFTFQFVSVELNNMYNIHAFK